MLKDHSTVYTKSLHLCKILEYINQYTVTKQVFGHLRTSEGVGERHEEVLGGIIIATILFVVLVSWANTYVKTYQIIHFKYEPFIACQLLFLD